MAVAEFPGQVVGAKFVALARKARASQEADLSPVLQGEIPEKAKPPGTRGYCVGA